MKITAIQVHDDEENKQNLTTRPEPIRPFVISFLKDIASLALKPISILLALTAYVVLDYLRTIHRTDLFLSAISSASGLSALLGATFILLLILTAVFAAPSWFASQIAHTYEKTETPPRSAALYVIFSGIVSAGAFFVYTKISDPAHASECKNFLKWILLLLYVAVLFLVACLSPSGCATLTESERKNTKLRLLRSGFRALLVFLSGIATTSPLIVFDDLLPLYGLGDDDWRAWLFALSLFPATLFVGAVYVFRRSQGDSGWTAFMRSAGSTAMTIFVPLFVYASPKPLAHIVMRTLSMVESQPRIYELEESNEYLFKSEQGTLRALGFRFIGKSSLFVATIRFQFGEVRLLCADPFDIAGPQPILIPQTGCATPSANEVKVVQPAAPPYPLSFGDAGNKD